MKLKKFMVSLFIGVLLIFSLTACGNKTGNKEDQTKKSDETTDNGSETNQGEQGDNDVIDVEFWTTNTGYLPIEKDSELYNFYKDLIGVGIIHPYVEWNGGITYQEQLNIRIGSGEMPDIFTPFEGMEIGLIENGALLDLTDLLPEYAPNLWNLIPEEVWDAMRANDPTGEGRIYVIPNVIDYGRNGGMIRKDWLDAVDLKMPTTQEEYVEVLKAFKNDDPNGNGLNDELPSGGRAEARWMDHLFAMYGIAMWEGFPQWDIYDGELTYSAVTPNMRDALEWISTLYEEGLIDAETLLNDKPAWDGKIHSNIVGNWTHIPQETYMYAETIEGTTGVKPEIEILPVFSAGDYEGFATALKVNGAELVVKDTDDEAKIQAVMKLLNAYGDTSLWNDFYNGVEGMHSEKVDGTLMRLPDDKRTQQNLVLSPYNAIATVDFQVDLLEGQMTSEREWAISQSIRNIQENQKYVKSIAGDGIPSSIYNDHPDIQNRTLYMEYASKIIIGEYPIEKFDEFVEKWYTHGGKEVTQAARKWYNNK